jgi:uracil-DNA glycosylase family 4
MMTTSTRIESGKAAPVAAASPLVDKKNKSPDHDCGLCPRLRAFRDDNRRKQPDWFNAPVPAFGPPDAAVLIVGLAPGLRGANRTGRPFTGDYAGDLLYSTLLELGFASGRYDARPDDGLMLRGCRIANAVHCVPPQNKPLPQEIKTCRQFLEARLGEMAELKAIVPLGRIAHDSTLKALGVPAARAPFTHGAVHDAGRFKVYDSYHCSRYNTNTGVLTPDMFKAVFARVRADLGLPR